MDEPSSFDTVPPIFSQSVPRSSFRVALSCIILHGTADMVLSKSKRVQRIFRCLLQAQLEDQILSPSATPLIRYNLLHNYHRCVQVYVDLGSPSNQLSCSFALQDLPRFLQSQLEAQHIANDNSVCSQVSPILTFIQANIRNLGKLHRFPTLFIWYSKEYHRSFFFFAFLDVKMTSKTYTAKEILRTRQFSAGKELYSKLAQRLWRDSDLGRFK